MHLLNNFPKTQKGGLYFGTDRLVFIVVLAIIGSVYEGKAQYRQVLYTSDSLCCSSNGNVVLDVGKSLTYTGMGLFTGALLMGGGEKLMEYMKILGGTAATQNINNKKYYTVGAGLLSEVMLLVGIPVWIAGLARQRDCEECLGESKGYGFRVDLTGGYAPMVGADVVAGYHFGPNLFLGVGLGQRFVQAYMFPIYVDARFTFSQKRIAPYLGLDMGSTSYKVTNKSLVNDSVCEFPRDFFMGISFGTRIRSRFNDRSRGDWWIGASSELVFYAAAPTCINTGLRVGFSF